MLAAGALDAVAEQPSVALVFYGDPAVIEPRLAGTRHRVVAAKRCIELDDPLRATLRGELASSMRAAVAAVAAGDADAVVSAGNTGALMALSRHLIGMLPGIRRPAIVKALAGEDGREFHLLDLGANIGADAAQLHQFAHMGAAAAIKAGASQPTVGLLNIGSEVSKGPRVVRAAAELVASDGRLRYAGFVEPDRMFAAGPDVVVADGFAGNIALKAAEGAARMARYLLAEQLRAANVGELRQRLQNAGEAYNPQRYNGAILLGLASLVVKSHGKADRHGFASAVRQAVAAHAGTLVAEVAGRA